MNEDINAWLNSGKDYETGCALYDKYGSSASLKRLHRMNGPTRQTMESIEYELRHIHKNSPAPRVSVPLARPLAKKEPVRPKPVVPVTPEPSPRRPNTPEVDAVKQEVIHLMKVRDSLHSTLEHVTAEQRATDAQRILDISDEIDAIYQRLEHYDTHGVLPARKAPVEPKKLEELDIVELMNKQQNLRSYVSRYKRLMKQAKTPAKKAEHKHRMETFQLELNDVEKRLKK